VNDSVKSALQKSGIDKIVGSENIFSNITAAMQKAEEIMSKN
jgi:hypothetical protein